VVLPKIGRFFGEHETVILSAAKDPVARPPARIDLDLSPVAFGSVTSLRSE
jgi:hypothetical protein